MKTTPAMRARIIELATPAQDDFDRAVLLMCDDFRVLELKAENSQEAAKACLAEVEILREALKRLKDAVFDTGQYVEHEHKPVWAALRNAQVALGRSPIAATDN